MRLLTDEQWARLAPCLPRDAGKAGRPFADHRRIVEGIIYRYRTGIPWRDLPREAFGPWQTVGKRHRRWATDGTWDTALAQLTAQAHAIGGIDWTVSVDSTINRAHQHATNTARPEKDTGAVTCRSKSEKDPSRRGRQRPSAGRRSHSGPGPRSTGLPPRAGRHPGPATRQRQAAHYTGRSARRQGVRLPADPRRPRAPRYPCGDPRTRRSAG